MGFLPFVCLFVLSVRVFFPLHIRWLKQAIRLCEESFEPGNSQLYLQVYCHLTTNAHHRNKDKHDNKENSGAS